MLEAVAKRQMPIVGGGSGIWSFIHIDDAASATALAVDRGAPGIYNIVDDEPAPVSEWLPYLADVLGAKPPRRVPAWLARLIVGEPGGVDDDQDPWLLQRQGEAGAGLETAVPELAGGIQGGALSREHVARWMT